MENSYSYKAIIGILAGLFTAVIGMAIISISNVIPYCSLFFGCFISLPIFFSAFRYGTLSSFFALISATFILSIINNIYIGFGFLLLFFLPSAYASWLLGLAQPIKEENSLIWYPLSSVIFLLTNFIACISTLIGIYVQNHPAAPIIAKRITENIVQTMRQSQSIKETDIFAFSELLTTHTATLIAVALTVYSLIFFIANLYFSMTIARHIKWLRRPYDDWKQNFRLPIFALIIFIVASIASMIEISFIFNLSANVFTTAYILTISVSGLAYLHNITKEISGRIIILSLVYIAILTVIFTVPISFMLLLMGIWATIQYNSQSRKSY
ncbi:MULTISPECIES: hypothetical protein [unclassified Bartonella]|uniref:hypothetical protein n=1 Tax=unclassified Bartonella TaxID=2645622 RepID=UPI00099B0715|nr:MULTISPECIES: hypothetical protein [unclassified Bartonella]AQX27804.1 hypothetical protein BJB15x_003920 [Bartonella sp. JB15]AQX29086.1 hypothetical protein BJB63x_003920 [Bartonella sp. JB63]